MLQREATATEGRAISDLIKYKVSTKQIFSTN